MQASCLDSGGCPRVQFLGGNGGLEQSQPAGGGISADADGDLRVIYSAREKLLPGLSDASLGQTVVDPARVPALPVDSGGREQYHRHTADTIGPAGRFALLLSDFAGGFSAAKELGTSGG